VEAYEPPVAFGNRTFYLLMKILIKSNSIFIKILLINFLLGGVLGEPGFPKKKCKNLNGWCGEKIEMKRV